MTATNNRALSAKESALFKQILKFYEFKQYKKGNKLADQILKKHPNHGETLSMKGLLVSHLGQKDEAYEYIKRGIRSDITSHICWHVYGLLNRNDKNYEEAIKCYANALKYDADNVNILRDYSLLQLHTRSYEDFADSRNQLLTLRPALRLNWLGLAVAYDLQGRADLAEKVLDACETSFKQGDAVVAKPEYERSEMLLYRNGLIRRSGDAARALADLEAIRLHVMDRQAWLAARGALQLELDQAAAAHSTFFELVQNNGDSLDAIRGLAAARGVKLDGELSNVEKDAALDFCAELAETHPRSLVLAHLPLAIAPAGPRFQEALDRTLEQGLRKGVPALFRSIRSTLEDPAKSALVAETVKRLCANLEAHGRFRNDGPPEPLTAVVWMRYLLAQLADARRDHAAAHAELDKALEIAPTLVELLMLRARVHKHQGNMLAAVAAMETARQMDLQDRFVNTRCAKYLLRHNQVDQAVRTVALFMRADVTDPQQELVDLQYQWFALEAGASFMRQRQLGRALKRFVQIARLFADMYDDQFDFHAYSLRRATLRAYGELLRVEDSLRLHPYYRTAAIAGAEIYLLLHREPSAAAAGALGGDASALGGQSAAELRKAARKAKKAELKRAAGPVNASAAASSGTAAAADPKKDSDPDGVELLKASAPLDEAAKLLQPLLGLAGVKAVDDAAVWVAAAETHAASGRLLLAWRCVKKLRTMENVPGALVLAEVHYWAGFKAHSSAQSTAVMELLCEEKATSPPSLKTQQAAVSQIVASASSFTALTRALCASVRLGDAAFTEKQMASARQRLEASSTLPDLSPRSLADFCHRLSLLLRVPAEAHTPWLALGRRMYPLSTLFA